MIGAILVMIDIVKRQKQAVSVLLEFICFVFLYASVFENFATLMGWYGYGRSLLMLFNVPLSVPIMEYIVVYCALRIAETMKLPLFGIPVFAGTIGMLTDFSLDPLAVSQRFVTIEGEIGRWTWFPGTNEIQIFRIPIYNFTGWFLLCGYAALLISLGRRWYEKTRYPRAVGYLYPPLAMLLSLLVLVSPISNFLLWLEPLMKKGSIGEIIMVCLVFVTFIAVLFHWRIKINERPVWKKDSLYGGLLIGFQCSHLLFTIIGGYWEILPFTLPFAAALLLLIAYVYKKEAVTQT
jgi:hypothetical protein